MPIQFSKIIASRNMYIYILYLSRDTYKIVNIAQILKRETKRVKDIIFPALSPTYIILPNILLDFGYDKITPDKVPCIDFVTLSFNFEI